MLKQEHMQTQQHGKSVGSMDHILQGFQPPNASLTSMHMDLVGTFQEHFQALPEQDRTFALVVKARATEEPAKVVNFDEILALIKDAESRATMSQEQHIEVIEKRLELIINLVDNFLKQKD